MCIRVLKQRNKYLWPKLKRIGIKFSCFVFVFINFLVLYNCNNETRVIPSLCLKNDKDSLRVSLLTSYEVVKKMQFKENEETLILKIYTQLPYFASIEKSNALSDTIIKIPKNVRFIKFNERIFVIDSLKTCKDRKFK